MPGKRNRHLNNLRRNTAPDQENVNYLIYPPECPNAVMGYTGSKMTRISLVFAETCQFPSKEAKFPCTVHTIQIRQIKDQSVALGINKSS